MDTRQKPDSLLNTLVATVRFGLVFLGLIGLSVEIFRDNGWLKQLFGKMISSQIGLASIPIAIIVLFLVNRWLSSAAKGKTVTRGDWPLYLMMAIGAFFLFNLLTTGRL